MVAGHLNLRRRGGLMSHPTPPVVTIHRNGSSAPLNYLTADPLTCGLKRDTARDQSGFTPYIPWRLRKGGPHPVCDRRCNNGCNTCGLRCAPRDGQMRSPRRTALPRVWHAVEEHSACLQAVQQQMKSRPPRRGAGGGIPWVRRRRSGAVGRDVPPSCLAGRWRLGRPTFTPSSRSILGHTFVSTSGTVRWP
jgi:hypothetical protein